jgi:hypothetical protein
MRTLMVFATGLFFGWLGANYSDVPKEKVRANLAELYHAVVESR